MWRLRLFVLSWCAVFVVCAGLFYHATYIRPFDVMTTIWMVSGTLLLVPLAYDLVLLAAFLLCRIASLYRRESLVPRSLSNDQLRELATDPPPTAVIIPAHCEIRTSDDFDAFVRRLIGVIRSTPRWSSVWVLFDSPVDEQRRERSAIECVKTHLQQLGLSYHADRLFFAEYRGKPPILQNKPGSIWLWLQEHQEVQYVFILDADSSVGSLAGPWSNHARHVVERALVAIRAEPRTAFVQGMLLIGEYRSLWGWFQFEGSQFGASYNAPIMEALYAHQGPFYGHGALWDTKALREVCELSYLSHDLIESAAAASLGYKCRFSSQIVTYETAEDSFLGFCARSLRWGRGNIQWTLPLVRNWFSLPIGPKVYLALGLLMYLLPLAGITFLIASSILLRQWRPMFHSINVSSTAALMFLTVLGLTGNRLLVNTSCLRTLGWAILGVFMSPVQMAIDSAIFLSAPFNSRWVARDARTLRFTVADLRRLVALCLPVSLLGLVMVTFVVGIEPQGFGEFLCFILAVLLLISPVTVILVSLPLATPRSSSAPRFQGLPAH